jgi:hypothetical protein
VQSLAHAAAQADAVEGAAGRGAYGVRDQECPSGALPQSASPHGEELGEVECAAGQHFDDELRNETLGIVQEGL